MGLNTTPRTWVAGEKPPAATLNTEIRDALTGIQAAWTSYTPTLTNITLGNGTVVARYLQIGKTITVSFLFTAGSTTTYGGAFSVSLPVTAQAGNASLAVGGCLANPAGTRFACVAGLASTTTVSFALPGGGSVGSPSAPGTWGTTSVMGFTITYEAA